MTCVQIEGREVINQSDKLSSQVGDYDPPGIPDPLSLSVNLSFVLHPANLLIHLRSFLFVFCWCSSLLSLLLLTDVPVSVLSPRSPKLSRRLPGVGIFFFRMIGICLPMKALFHVILLPSILFVAFSSAPNF